MNNIMQVITAIVLGCFGLYIGAWYFGKIDGNFALLLFMATCVTGVYWLAELLYFKPKRALDGAPAVTPHVVVDAARTAARFPLTTRAQYQPWWLDWTAGLFPVILIVFLLRSFLFEPFKIPSGSMIPTLQIGDLILVNKFHYGVRLPVINKKITDGTPVARGDVMVFRYPPKPSLDYIKRVVGLPGDTVAYINKTLTINGQPVSKDALPDYFDEDQMTYFKLFGEQLGTKYHQLLNSDRRSAGWSESDTEANYPNKQNCQYSDLGVTCKVPEGHYFMMGDNRDNSLDSRYFGFVPDANIVGRAFFVWMNFGNLKRIGGFE
jgi:signal peptidase I